MDYFNLMLKMLKTFHLLHRNLLADFKNATFDLELNRTQRRVLMHLYEDQEHTMSSLCKRTELQQGSMTSVIDSLEEYNYVQRTRKKTDRRKLFITLTPEGVQVAEQLKIAMNQYLETKLANLAKEDILKFASTLDDLLEINEKLNQTKGGTHAKNTK